MLQLTSILNTFELKVTYSVAKCHSSYYSVRVIARALRMRHDTEHEKVAKQHI